MNIILGSTSPRRKNILSGLINNFDILAPEINEKKLNNEKPLEYSIRISKEKSRSILSRYSISKPALLITCDTVVTIDNLILGKPENFEKAVQIIKSLNKKTHIVISSLTLAHFHGNQPANYLTCYEITKVKFKNLTDNEITTYLKKINFRDKAGGYALQEYGDSIIERYIGSATNIIGFPLKLFFSMISTLNITSEVLNNE